MLKYIVQKGKKNKQTWKASILKQKCRICCRFLFVYLLEVASDSPIVYLV